MVADYKILQYREHSREIAAATEFVDVNGVMVPSHLADEIQGEREKLKLSIVIPVAKESKFIRDVLGDLREGEMEFGEMEVIVALNNTDLPTIHAVDGEARSFPSDISVIHRMNGGGVGNARNVGTRFSRGDVILYLDADVRVNGELYDSLERLSELRAVLPEEVKDRVLRAFRFDRATGESRRSIWNSYEKFMRDGLGIGTYSQHPDSHVKFDSGKDQADLANDLNRLQGFLGGWSNFVRLIPGLKGLVRPPTAGGAMMVRREFFDAAGGFPEDMHLAEDLVFGYEVMRAGAKIGVIGGVTISNRRQISDLVTGEIGATEKLLDATVGRYMLSPRSLRARQPEGSSGYLQKKFTGASQTDRR